MQNPTKHATPYIWQPRAINIWHHNDDHTAHIAQSKFMDTLRDHIREYGCYFLDDPKATSPLGEGATLAVGFGTSYAQELPPTKIYRKLPKPRGTMLVITFADDIPDDMIAFDIGRSQIARKGCHIHLLVDGTPDGEIRRALWSTMIGNYKWLDGQADDFYAHIAQRIVAYASVQKINSASDNVPDLLTWSQWENAPLHDDIARASRILGEHHLLEDQFDVKNYASGQQMQTCLRFLERAAIGEGMHSQLDLELGIMGISKSGGNKVNVSPDANEGHILPIYGVTRNGYVTAIPADCPIEYTAPPSVETHENVLIYHASALVAAGIVSTFEDFMAYLDRHFDQEVILPVLPDDMTPTITKIEHFHYEPDTLQHPELVEIVTPDETYFSHMDFPCGVLESERLVLSALFKSEIFTSGQPLDERLIVLVLPGHGSVVLYDGNRLDLAHTLVNEMTMREVRRV